MIKTSLKNYHQYLPELTRDQRRVLRANPSLANKIVNDSVNKQRTFRCSICDRLILDFHGYFQRVTCSSKCMTEGKAHLKGKKRPEHSALMRVKIREAIAEGRLWNEAHRASNKAHLEKVNAALTTEQRSTARKGVGHWRRVLLRSITAQYDFMNLPLYKSSRLAKLTKAAVRKMGAKELRSLVAEFNSLKSVYAASVNPNMGATAFYKRVTIRRLKFHKGNKSVTVRSSLEYDFVKWLERNGVPWKYEWASMRYTHKDRHHIYTPDFKIWIGGEVWVVEVKGFYTEASFAKERKKMITCAAKCYKLGYKMALLTTRSIGKLGDNVDPSSWENLSELTDSQITAFMRRTIPGGNKC